MEAWTAGAKTTKAVVVCDQTNIDARLSQIESFMGVSLNNAQLVTRHIEHLYSLICVQDAVMASLEDKLRCLYQLITPRFNEYFRSEAEARVAWTLFTILLGTPEAPFPADTKKPRRSLPVIEA